LPSEFRHNARIESSGPSANGSKGSLRFSVGNHPHAHGDDRLIAILRREIIDAGVATSAALGFARGDVIATAELLAADVSSNALFDLASLTKPLTALSLLCLVVD